MAVEAENKARKHGNTCPEGVGDLQVLKSAQWGHMNIISLSKTFFSAKSAHTHRKNRHFALFPGRFCKGI